MICCTDSASTNETCQTMSVLEITVIEEFVIEEPRTYKKTKLGKLKMQMNL